MSSLKPIFSSGFQKQRAQQQRLPRVNQAQVQRIVRAIQDEKRRYPVHILFLAHEGVSQPDVWEQWKELAAEVPDIHVYYHVLTTPKVLRKQPFCAKYVLQDDIDSVHTLDKTGWASFSLVAEMIKGFVAIERMYRRPDGKGIILLTSGTDIPIRHPADLIDLTMDNNDIIPYAGTPKGSLIPYAHSQWIGLRFSSVARYLASVDMFILFEACMEAINHKPQFVVAPDEFFYSMIRPIPPPRSRGLHMNCGFIMNISTPVCWTSLLTPQLVARFDRSPPRPYNKVNLAQILLEIKGLLQQADHELYSTNFFFRKIASSVVFPSGFFVNYLWNQEINYGHPPRAFLPLFDHYDPKWYVDPNDPNRTQDIEPYIWKSLPDAWKREFKQSFEPTGDKIKKSTIQKKRALKWLHQHSRSPQAMKQQAQRVNYNQGLLSDDI